MILLIAGTTESKQIMQELVKRNAPFMATVATDYGYALFSEHLAEIDGLGIGKIVQEKFTVAELIEMIRECSITKIIDASHPFALQITRIASAAAAKAGIQYERVNREHDPVSKFDNVHIVKGFREAAQLAQTLGQNIFLTIGTRNLMPFVEYCQADHLTVRVLDWDESLDTCHQIGIRTENVISQRGPFSVEENIRQFIARKAHVIVTKNSGRYGGLREKIIAAHTLHLPIVVIDLPSVHEVGPDLERSIEQNILEQPKDQKE